MSSFEVLVPKYQKLRLKFSMSREFVVIYADAPFSMRKIKGSFITSDTPHSAAKSIFRTARKEKHSSLKYTIVERFKGKVLGTKEIYYWGKIVDGKPSVIRYTSSNYMCRWKTPSASEKEKNQPPPSGVKEKNQPPPSRVKEEVVPAPTPSKNKEESSSESSSGEDSEDESRDSSRFKILYKEKVDVLSKHIEWLEKALHAKEADYQTLESRLVAKEAAYISLDREKVKLENRVREEEDAANVLYDLKEKKLVEKNFELLQQILAKQEEIISVMEYKRPEDEESISDDIKGSDESISQPEESTEENSDRGESEEEESTEENSDGGEGGEEDDFNLGPLYHEQRVYAGLIVVSLFYVFVLLHTVPLYASLGVVFLL